MANHLDDSALDRIFRTARSYNGYDGTPVTEGDVRRIYDLLKWGPTSANQQSARFVWLLSQDQKDRLADCATGTNGPKIRAAPATVIIGMDLEFREHLPWLFPHDQTAREWFGSEEVRLEQAFRNSSLQGAYLLIAARALGFDTGPMSGFDGEKVDKAFFSDQPSVRTNFICTLGHGDPTTIFPRLPRPEFDRFNRIG
ncbi:malonic semialdehyde reductase [Sphingobium amiense]|nr:malonic semialdehyde reductase [Sphingobium amiense]